MAKQRTTSDAAAQELWRIAEMGDVKELGRIFLRGADVNSRNKHGMTALMRAAYHGHAPMVRALLERGADPNLTRNDKFTALALAAFFGHTETVRVLIEHGAKTEVVTRCGASARTWAIARTFEEAARCLESSAPVPAPAPASAQARAAAPPARAAAPARTVAPAPVAKALKDPPEIWDLVQEVPRTFTARSAFVSRLQSMKTSFALGIAAAVVVSLASVVGVLVFKGSEARNLPVEAPAKQTVVANEVSAPKSAEKTEIEPVVEPSISELDEVSHHSEPAEGEKPSRKVNLTRQTRSRFTPVEEPVETVQIRAEPPVASPAVASPQIEPRNSNKANTKLSPQLIAPAKSASPKAKVIQWP